MVAKLVAEGFRFVTYKEVVGATHILTNREDDQAIIWRLFGEE